MGSKIIKKTKHTKSTKISNIQHCPPYFTLLLLLLFYFLHTLGKSMVLLMLHAYACFSLCQTTLSIKALGPLLLINFCITTHSSNSGVTSDFNVFISIRLVTTLESFLFFYYYLNLGQVKKY